MKRWLWILLVVAWPATASAEKVVFFSTGGPGGGKVGKVLLKVLKTQLSSHQVVKKKRPRKWKRARGPKLRKAVGKTARKAKAAIGVDSHITRKGGRSLVVVAVDTEGGVVLEETLALTKDKKASRSAIMELGRRLAGEINGRLGGDEPPPPKPIEESGPEPTVTEFEDDELEELEPIEPLIDEEALNASPEAEEEPPPPPPENVEPVAIENPDFLGSGPVDLEEAAMLQIEATDKRKRKVRVGTRSVHLTVRAGAGAAGYDDEITTSVPGGNLVRSVAGTFHTSFGLELEVARWFELTIDGHRNAAKMRLQGTSGSSGVIKVSELGAVGQLGATFDLGPVRAGLRGGASFDMSSVGDNPIPGLTLPAWNRLLVLAGIVIGHGGHGDDGISFQLGALYAPWGIYNEDPVTSGNSPTFVGGLAWLRARYQMPILFGMGGGVFFELAGSGEYMMAKFSGEGTRTAPINDQPVTNAEQTRFGWTGTASVGYVY